MNPREIEQLLREYIAALDRLKEIYDEYYLPENGEIELKTVADCDLIQADDINSYWIDEKLSELRNKLLSLPL
jgi:hypothetical protein